MNPPLLAEGECAAGMTDIGGQAGCAFASAADGILISTFMMIVNGAIWAVKWIGAAWLTFPEPTIGTADGTPATNLSTLWSLTGFYVLGIAVIGFLFAVMRLMASPSMQTGGAILRGILAITAVQSLSIGATVLLLDAGNQFSTWVVEKASGKGFQLAFADFSGLGGASKSWLAVGTAAEVPNMVAVGIVGMILLLLGAIAQVALLIVRAALLMVLLAFLPALAASAFTEGGHKALSKAIGWLLALILYKPVAGVIYAVGILTLKNVPENASLEDQMMNLLIGIVIVIAAALALPALVKFVAPQAAAGASMAFSGGALAAGAVGTGAAVVAMGATMGAAAPAVAGSGAGASTGAATMAGSGADTAATGAAEKAASTGGGGSKAADAGGSAGGKSGVTGDGAESSGGKSGVTGDGGGSSASTEPGDTSSGGAKSGGTPGGASAPSTKGAGSSTTGADSAPSGEGQGSSSQSGDSDGTGASNVDNSPTSTPGPVSQGSRAPGELSRRIGQVAERADQGAKDVDFNRDGDQS